MPTSDPHVIYNRFSENLLLTADTISVDGGTIETGYSIELIRDGRNSRPVRLSTLKGMFKAHWASPVAPELVAIGHANYLEGLDIYIQGNDSDSWTSPAFEYVIQAPAWRVGRYPGQPWEYLPDKPNFGAHNYWRVGTLDDNTVNVTVGEIWLGSTTRRLDPDFAEGRRPAISQPRIEHQTAYRKIRSQLGKINRSVTGQIPPTDDELVQDVLDWMVDADGRAFLFIPDGTVGEAWWAIHTMSEQELQDLLDHDATTFSLTIEEDGRGLEPTPSPLA